MGVRLFFLPHMFVPKWTELRLSLWRSPMPCIRDTRITIHDVLSWFAGGMGLPRIIEDFPQLSEDDIRAC